MRKVNLLQEGRGGGGDRREVLEAIDWWRNYDRRDSIYRGENQEFKYESSRGYFNHNS